MKVCLFLTYGMSLADWEESGVLSRELLLYEALSKRGVEIGVASYGGESDREIARAFPWITLIRIPKSRLGVFWSLWKQRSLLSRFDIFKTNQMRGAWVAMLAAWLTGGRFLVRCGYEHYRLALRHRRGLLKRVAAFWSSWIAYREADRILLTSRSAKEFVVDQFAISPEKISVFQNVIDVEKFSPGTPSEEKRVLFVGRLSDEKNLEWLIRVFSESGVGLDLLGDGPLKARLQSLAELKKADVRFLNRVANDQLPETYRRYRYFVLPSKSEGNPKVLLEAMSCGLTVLGADVEGINELVQDGKTGYLFSESRPLKVLLGQLTQLEDTGVRAREFVRENCRLELILSEELEVYGLLSDKEEDLVRSSESRT